MTYFVIAKTSFKLDSETYFKMTLKQFFQFADIFADHNNPEKAKAQPKEKKLQEIKNLGSFLSGR